MDEAKGKGKMGDVGHPSTPPSWDLRACWMSHPGTPNQGPVLSFPSRGGLYRTGVTWEVIEDPMIDDGGRKHHPRRPADLGLTGLIG